MTKLKRWQGVTFTKDNLPDLLEYLADYMREYPDCEKGFGLESWSAFHDWMVVDTRIGNIFDNLYGASTVEYRPAPLTKTMYNIHTGEAVEVPIDESDTISAVCKVALPAVESVEKLFSK